MNRFRLVLAVFFMITAASCTSVPQPAPRSAALADGIHQPVLNGVRHWYKVAGTAPDDAPPAVFLHGGPGGDSYAFEMSAGRLLERGLRMVYFEQRGSGRSESAADGNYAIATLAEDLEALRVHLGVPKISVITHSFGTAIGLAYGARYPDRLARMVITGGLADAPASCRDTSRRLARERPELFANTFPHGVAAVSDDEMCERSFGAIRGREGEEYRMAGMFATPADRQRFEMLDKASGLTNRGVVGNYQFRNGLLRYRFTDQARLTMPVLVVSGLHDWAAGPEAQRKLARGLPDGKLVEYPDAGHWMFVDDPERFARDVVPFLQGR